MKLLWPVGLLLVILAGIFLYNQTNAQQFLAPGPPTGIACAYNSSPPTIATGQAAWVQCDSSGHIITGTGIVTVVPYAFTPLSPGQHNVAITSSTGTGLSPPTGATYAVIQAKVATVSYTLDGTTVPTSAKGSTLAVGSSLALSGAAEIAAFLAISATGTLDVEYAK
jgi:hypothetical protein